MRNKKLTLTSASSLWTFCNLVFSGRAYNPLAISRLHFAKSAWEVSFALRVALVRNFVKHHADQTPSQSVMNPELCSGDIIGSFQGRQPRIHNPQSCGLCPNWGTSTSARNTAPSFYVIWLCVHHSASETPAIPRLGKISDLVCYVSSEFWLNTFWSPLKILYSLICSPKKYPQSICHGRYLLERGDIGWRSQPSWTLVKDKTNKKKHICPTEVIFTDKHWDHEGLNNILGGTL